MPQASPDASRAEGPKDRRKAEESNPVLTHPVLFESSCQPLGGTFRLCRRIAPGRREEESNLRRL